MWLLTRGNGNITMSDGLKSEIGYIYLRVYIVELEKRLAEFLMKETVNRMLLLFQIAF